MNTRHKKTKKKKNGLLFLSCDRQPFTYFSTRIAMVFRFSVSLQLLGQALDSICGICAHVRSVCVRSDIEFHQISFLIYPLVRTSGSRERFRFGEFVNTAESFALDNSRLRAHSPVPQDFLIRPQNKRVRASLYFRFTTSLSRKHSSHAV